MLDAELLELGLVSPEFGYGVAIHACIRTQLQIEMAYVEAHLLSLATEIFMLVEKPGLFCS